MPKAKSIRGLTYELGAIYAQGGQGDVYKATRADRPGVEYIVKQFNTVDKGMIERTKFIAEANFSAFAPTLAAPTDAIANKKELAVVSKFIPHAITLAELLEKGPLPGYADLLMIGLQVAHAAAFLHPAVDAHGDLHAGNVMVRQEGGVWRAWLIDFDNFAALGLPPPPALGFPAYMAPELVTAKALPSHATDVFALAGLLHEVLFLCSPFDGLGVTDADFERARNGHWIYDPRASRASFKGAIPVAAQHPHLIDLFRRTLQPNPCLRPHCKDFYEVLSHLVMHDRLGQCAACGHPFVLHGTLAGCPQCGACFTRRLMSASGNTVDIKSAMRFGRNHCGSPYVSEEHVSLQVKGVELFVTALSHNSPTFIAGHQGWCVLPAGQTACLTPGTGLRLADCEFLAV